MWGLSGDWLETHPALDDILDRLREIRRLPEQRDYSAWKKDHLRVFDAGHQHIEETWHAPNGTSVDMKTYPYLLGGVVYLFNDISERLRSEAAYNMLAQIQRATINTVEEGIAVFGLDGRLKLHNDAFARLWRLENEELDGEPHLTRVADLCVARTGPDGIWNMISTGVNANEPTRFGEWGNVSRADGRVLSLALSRLPLGATLVTFADVTDALRFDAEFDSRQPTIA
jgi:PAS domain-containing protein